MTSVSKEGRGRGAAAVELGQFHSETGSMVGHGEGAHRTGIS